MRTKRRCIIFWNPIPVNKQQGKEEYMRIAVIGGGASGMMAALQAAGEGVQVTIYEKNERIGKKLLSTGNGKCNFSNRNLNSDCYHGGDKKKIAEVLARFDTKACEQFFRDLGMLIKERNGGLYPVSEQASTVLDLFRRALAAAGTEIITECEVVEIVPAKGSFDLETMHQGKRRSFQADRVILAAGSRAGTRMGEKDAPVCLLKKLCLPVQEEAPALVQLRCSEDYMKAVAGVRLEARLTIYIEGKETACERGELQLTDYGISGIPTFQLSRFAAYALKKKQRVIVHIDCLPAMNQQDYEAMCKERSVLSRTETAEDFFLGIAHKKLTLLFLRLAGIKPGAPIATVPEAKKQKMFQLYRCFPVTVTGTNSFEQAQVCAGGLKLEAVSDRLEVLKIPGLYVTGELLDADGRCGGYNLQWAFATGYLAGRCAKGVLNDSNKSD